MDSSDYAERTRANLARLVQQKRVLRTRSPKQICDVARSVFLGSAGACYERRFTTLSRRVFLDNKISNKKTNDVPPKDAARAVRTQIEVASDESLAMNAFESARKSKPGRLLILDETRIFTKSS